MAWGSLRTTLQMPILILGRDITERLPKKNEAGVYPAVGNLLFSPATPSCPIANPVSE